MYDTAVTWRTNFIRFVEEDHGVLIKSTWYYYVDDKTGTKNYIGSNSGDFPISKDRALQAFNEMKNQTMNGQVCGDNSRRKL